MVGKGIIRGLVTVSFLVGLLLPGSSASCQPGMDKLAKLQSVMNSFRNVNIYSYDYSTQVSYPDGTREQAKGMLYRDGVNKVFYSKSDMHLYLFDSKWLFNADHDKKEVAIADVEKHGRDTSTLFVSEDLFSTQFSDEFIDSFIARYAEIKTYRENKDTLQLVLDVSRGGEDLKRIELCYNQNAMQPFWLGLYLTINIGMDDKGKPQVINQYIKCSNYSFKTRKFKTEELFRVKNGKVSLRKFKDYKLETLL